MPKVIEIKDVIKGMQLAGPLKNRYGQMLLAADTVLEERHIKIFQTWGIEKVTIKVENEGIAEKKYDENTINDAKNILSSRLKWKPKNFNEEDLYQTALKHVLIKNF